MEESESLNRLLICMRKEEGRNCLVGRMSQQPAKIIEKICQKEIFVTDLCFQALKLYVPSLHLP